MKLTKSHKSKEKSYKKELQKQRKASGNGEYNIIKYVRYHHHTRYMKAQCVRTCPAQSWHLNQAIYHILKSPIARA